MSIIWSKKLSMSLGAKPSLKLKDLPLVLHVDTGTLT